MQAKPGKTLRVGDSYKVVDSSNRSAFVLIGVRLLSYYCCLAVKNDLAKLTYSKAHTASYSQLKQLRLPILIINFISCNTYYNHLHYL